MRAVPLPLSSRRRTRRPIVAVLAVVGALAAATGPVGAQEAPVPIPAPEVPAVPGPGDEDGDRIADVVEAAAAAEPAGTVEVIVRLEPGTDPVAVATAAGDPDGTPLDLIDAVALEVPADRLDAVADIPGVDLVEEDAVVEAMSGDASTAIGAPAARTQAGVTGDLAGGATVYGPGDVVVAVLDTGIDSSHVDLDGGKVIGWFDAVQGVPTPYDDHNCSLRGTSGHGSHIAGTIAGTGEANPAMVGVAPGAALVGVKVLDFCGLGQLSDVLEGLDWVVANRGADKLGIEVVNLSLGFSPAAACGAPNTTLHDAVAATVAAGLVVVAAAGNSGPARCTMVSPATGGSAIVVGALSVRPGGRALVGAAYSSRGPTPDGRTGVDVVAPGNVPSVLGGPAAGGSKTGYTTKTGTSMATAVVSGVVALLLDGAPGLSNAQVRELLRTTATDWGDPGVDQDHGAGLVNAWAALGSVGAPPALPAHGRLQVTVPAGGSLVVPLTATAAGAVGVSLLHDYPMASSTANDLDLTVRPVGGGSYGSSASSSRLETVGATVPAPGLFEVVVTSSGSGGTTAVIDVDGAVAVPFAPPPAPTVSARGGTDRVTVSWSPNGGDPIAYTVSSDAGPIATVGAGTRTFTVAGIPEGTVATYRVRALNLAGSSPEGTASAGVARSAPFPTPEAFVAQQYRDFLLRDADPGGLAHWSNLMRSGVTGTSVIGFFLSSPEYEGRVASLARLYYAYFLRPPDPSGLQFWIEQRNGGQPLEWVSGFFSESPEFRQRYGQVDDVGFVQLVYANVLGRSPDFAGLVYWVDQLRTGRLDRGRVMLAFSESAEFRLTSSGEIDTTLVWFGMLRDIPSVADYGYWIPTIESGTSRLALVAALLEDGRYAARLGL